MTDQHLLWTLLLIGWVYFITEASIMSVVRIFVADTFGTLAEALIYCPACTAFWVGLILAKAGFWPYDDAWAPAWSGFAAMAVASTWSKALGGNNAWVVERGHLDEGDHDATQKSEAREEG